MLEKVIYFLSEISLIGGILCLFVKNIFKTGTLRSYFRCAKIAVLSSVAFSILFYNKSTFASFLEACSYSTLFYVITGLIAYIWLSLSFRWFTSEEKPAFGFCMMALTALLLLKIMIDSVNFGVLVTAVFSLILLHYSFLKSNSENESLYLTGRSYLICALILCALMFFSLYLLKEENWTYDTYSAALTLLRPFDAVLSATFILMMILFLLSIAPLYFWLPTTVAHTSLPIATYFSLVPNIILWGIFIKLNIRYFQPFQEQLAIAYDVFALLSIWIGAIGANTSRNLRKIFIFGNLYHSGVALLILAPFSETRILTGFLYVLIFMISELGLFASLYACRTNGTYLTNTNMLNGFAKAKPFIAAAMLIFIFSLLSAAPFLGFFGQFAALVQIEHQRSYFAFASVLLGLIFLTAAFFQVIKALYFTPKQTFFDRTDHGIYFYLVMILMLMGLGVLTPRLFLNLITPIFNTYIG